MIFLTIVIFILILGLLVFVHELGHFVVAKRAGMRVEEFGFGFPPRVFGVKKGETLYSLNLVPLGGFVKITGEDGQESSDPRSFVNKSAAQRFFVLIAGVSMNVVLAWFLISVGLGIGLPTIVSEGQTLPHSAKISAAKVSVFELAPGSPASLAGMKIGDIVVAVNGQLVSSIEQLQDLTQANAGKSTVYTIKRGSSEFQKTLVPRENPPEGQGALGVALAMVAKVSYPWYEVLFRGFGATANLVATTISAFWQLLVQWLSGQHITTNLSGPVGIAVLTRDVAELGFIYLLQFTALLSINLAVINAIPFPALDGGRVLFLAIEQIRGKKMQPKAEATANTIGFSLLLLLMAFVTFKDISHFQDRFQHLFERIKDIL